MHYTAVILSHTVIKFINLKDNMDVEKQGEAFSSMDAPGLTTVM